MQFIDLNFIVVMKSFLYSDESTQLWESREVIPTMSHQNTQHRSVEMLPAIYQGYQSFTTHLQREDGAGKDTLTNPTKLETRHRHVIIKNMRDLCLIRWKYKENFLANIYSIFTVINNLVSGIKSHCPLFAGLRFCNRQDRTGPQCVSSMVRLYSFPQICVS